MTVSKAKQAATLRYRAKAYDRVSIDVPKGKRALYNEKAASIGLSLAQLVQRAVEAYRADETAAGHVGKIGTSDDTNAGGEENSIIITQRTENAQNQPVSTNEQSIQPPAENATERITGTQKSILGAVNNLPPNSQENLLKFLQSLPAR